HVALLARHQPMIGMDARRGVLHALDVVMAVAIETLRRRCIAERADLAMIGVAVGMEVALVTRAAALGNREPDRICRRTLYLMRSVAVRANGCSHIPILHDLAAVHRCEVLVALPAVTGPAQAGNRLTPFGKALRDVLVRKLGAVLVAEE